MTRYNIYFYEMDRHYTGDPRLEEEIEHEETVHGCRFCGRCPEFDDGDYEIALACECGARTPDRPHHGRYHAGYDAVNDWNIMMEVKS